MTLGRVTILGLGAALTAFACSSSDAPTKLGAGDEADGGGADDAASSAPPPSTSTDEDAGPTGNTDDPTTASGARLRRELYTAPGAAVLSAFIDTARGGERCGFAPATDGAVRCLPFGKSVALYTAADCSEASILAASPPDEAAALTMRVPLADPCTPRHAIYTLGAPVASPPATLYTVSSGGACVTAGLSPGSVLRAVTAAVDPAAFAPASRQVEPGTTRLRRSQLVTDDGARLSDQLHDTTADSACTPRRDTAKTDSCMAGPIISSYFAAPDCLSLPLAVEVCGQRPAYAARHVDVLAGTWEALQVGTTEHVGTVYRRPASTCSSVSLSTKTYEATSMEVASLVQVTTAFEGPGRLQHSVTKGSDGSSLPLFSDGVITGALPGVRLFDKEQATTCGLETIEGVVRCLPKGLSAGGAFADDACTQPVIVASPVWTDAVPPHVFVRISTPDDKSIRRIGALTELPTFYTRSNAACVDAGVGVTKVALLGAPEPATTFAALTKTID